MKSKKIPSELATPHFFPLQDRNKIAEHINPLIADAFALYVKTKNYHWHLFGSHFRDYHILFDEQADQVFAMIDVLAERLRKLGTTTVRSIGHIQRLKTLKDSDEELLSAEQMIKQLINDNQQFADSLRKAHGICSKHHDVATTSLLEGFIDETERRIWFLFETISTNPTKKRV